MFESVNLVYVIVVLTGDVAFVVLQRALGLALGRCVRGALFLLPGVARLGRGRWQVTALVVAVWLPCCWGGVVCAPCAGGPCAGLGVCGCAVGAGSLVDGTIGINLYLMHRWRLPSAVAGSALAWGLGCWCSGLVRAVLRLAPGVGGPGGHVWCSAVVLHCWLPLSSFCLWVGVGCCVRLLGWWLGPWVGVDRVAVSVGPSHVLFILYFII